MQDKAWPRILPFALFMAIIGLEESLIFLDNRGWLDLQGFAFDLLYPLRPLAALTALLLLYRAYTELQWIDLTKWGQTLLSVCLGLLVFVLWINMDWTIGAMTEPPGFNPHVFPEGPQRWLMIAIRVSSAVIVVPIMEEIFWRSFLLRYIINSSFSKVPLGTFTWPSLLIGSLLFGLAHHFILAGIMAGIAYAWLLYRTKSLAQCILAHAVTNLALAIYVLRTEQWFFW
ncbi:CAAX prenyl protease-related protein [Desulfonatronum thiosulfatophilum]|nr:CAAX prenyl protease-related protein [Desulfonatronum thiosulfatophilum]